MFKSWSYYISFCNEFHLMKLTALFRVIVIVEASFKYLNISSS